MGADEIDLTGNSNDEAAQTAQISTSNKHLEYFQNQVVT